MQLYPIEQTNHDIKKLNDALNIYRETILPEAQNPERQILFWIEHSKEYLTDEFRCFSIQEGNSVIGYLQYSYFREEQIFFFEYLCIKDKRRKGLLPSLALKTIEEYIADNYPPNFTIVFEIAQIKDKNSNWIPDTKLIKYFQRLTFRQVEFEYHYPVLQSYDGEMSYPADLMVRLPESRTIITATELRIILRSIYFKHYLRWDRPFLDQNRFTERERLINELYSKILVLISNKDSFGTLGDDKRSKIAFFKNRRSIFTQTLNQIFRPKLMRLILLAIVLLIAEQILGSVLLLAPFVLALAALFCLAEDTKASRKLFLQILARIRFAPPRS
jgi:hypothetical protein